MDPDESKDVADDCNKCQSQSDNENNESDQDKNIMSSPTEDSSCNQLDQVHVDNETKIPDKSHDEIEESLVADDSNKCQSQPDNENNESDQDKNIMSPPTEDSSCSQLDQVHVDNETKIPDKSQDEIEESLENTPEKDKESNQIDEKDETDKSKHYNLEEGKEGRNGAARSSSTYFNLPHFNQVNLQHLYNMRLMKEIPNIPEGTRSGGFSSNHTDAEGRPIEWSYSDLVINWVENTSIHGIKFVTEKSDLRVRKLIWLIAVLTFTGLLIRQVSDRVQYYLGNQSLVQLDVAYNGSIIFPTVTICNQNKFRLTSVAVSGLYPVLAQVVNEGDNVNLEKIPRAYLETSMTDINNKGFTIEDMLLNCTWRNEPCTTRDFVPIRTDQGMCFSFNHKHPDELLHVESTGVNSGLSLLLNVQQYDYMPTMLGAAGVRFLAHSRHQYPMVSEIGMAVPAGSHAFVDLKAIYSTYLPEPYTKCRAEDLPDDKKYDEQNCLLECRASFYWRKCGCVESYMNGIDELYDTIQRRVCTLAEMYQCITPKARIFQSHERKKCNCPKSCRLLNYEASLSYSAMARSDLTRLDFLPAIQKANIRSRDVEGIVNQEKYLEDSKSVTRLNSVVANLKSYFNNELKMYITRNHDLVGDYLQNLIKLLYYKQNLFQKQYQAVEDNFVIGFTIADQRALSLVSHTFAQFLFQVESYINKLTATSGFVFGSETSFKQQVHFLGSLHLSYQKECINSSMERLSLLIHCYSTAQSCINKSNFNPVNVPKLTLKQPLNDGSVNWTKVNMNLQSLIDIIEIFEHEFENAVKIGKFNKKKFYKAKLEYIALSKEWMVWREKVKTVFESPLENLNVKRQKTHTQLDDLIKLHQNFERDIETINGTDIEHSINGFAVLEDLCKIAKSYIDGNNISKMPYNRSSVQKSNLAEYILSKYGDINKPMLYLDGVASNFMYIANQWRKSFSQIKDVSISTWKTILEDEDAYDQYRYNNLTWLDYNIANETSEAQKFYETLANFTELETINQMVGSLKVILSKWDSAMRSYHKKNQLSGQFVADNLVHLYFYFKEMTIQTITQKPAYEITALLSDIGGTLGLFVGCSILSLVEILDLFGQILYHRPKKVTTLNQVSKTVTKEDCENMELNPTDVPYLSITPSDELVNNAMAYSLIKNMEREEKSRLLQAQSSQPQIFS